MPLDKIRSMLPGKIHERYPSLFARGEVTEIPPWIQLDREVYYNTLFNVLIIFISQIKFYCVQIVFITY